VAYAADSTAQNTPASCEGDLSLLREMQAADRTTGHNLPEVSARHASIPQLPAAARS
jgi:hypothetical protein